MTPGPSTSSGLASREPDRVLLVWIGRLGDYLASTPFYRSARRRWPRARVVLLAGPKARELAELEDAVDEVWALGAPRQLWANAGVLGRLLRGRFDLAIDLNQSDSYSALGAMLLSRAPVRLSFDKPYSRRFYTDRVPWDPERDNVIRGYGRLAEAVGAPFEPRPAVRLSADHRREADARLRAAGADPATAWIAVHAGNFKKIRNRWPEAKFLELTRRLQLPGVSVFFLAGPGEEEPVLRMADEVPWVKVLGPAPAPVSAATLERMDLLVANSTGTMHLAVAVGTPTFTLFSRYTSAVWSAPEGPHTGVVSSEWSDCRPIAVDDAYRALAPVLERVRSEPKPKTLR